MFLVEVASITGVANLFLRSWTFLSFEKKHCKYQINAKNFKTFLIFVSISIKNDHKREKMASKICRGPGPAPKIEFSNFALKKEVWPPLLY